MEDTNALRQRKFYNVNISGCTEIKDAAIAAAHNVPSRHKSIKPRVTTKRLESFENLPDYLKDNE